MENRNGLKILAVIVLLVVSNYVSWNVGKSGGVSSISGVGASPAGIPSGMRAIGGTVESVTDSGFILKVPSFDPSASVMSVRTVSVNQATIIERLIQKDSATIQKEQSAFMEQIKKAQNTQGSPATNVPIIPPEPFKREKVLLKDITVGDMVSVSANEDISKAKQFVAVRVSIQSSLNLPVTAPNTSAPNAPVN